MASKFDPLKTCLHLRSKEMFYEDPDPASEEYEKETEPLAGRSDERLYWCQCTQTGRGPDDQPVSVLECARRTRRCFVGIHSLT